jgi:hypothetical protein
VQKIDAHHINSFETARAISYSKALLAIDFLIGDNYHYLVDREFPFWDLIKYIAEDEKVLQTPDVVRNLDYWYCVDTGIFPESDEARGSL